MPILAAAGIGAVGSIGSGLLGLFGADSAAKQQKNAANQALQLEQNQFAQTRSDLAPYRDAGGAGINQLLALLGLGPGGAGGQQTALAGTPGYQFTLDQGMQGLQNSLAARGGAMGGNALKAIMGYGQGLASTNFQQAVGDASGLAGIGENAAAATGTFGANAANAGAGLITGAGNAGAAGTMGGVNALAGGLGGIGQNALQYALLTQLANQSGGAGLGSNATMASLFTNNPAFAGFGTPGYNPSIYGTGP